MQGKACAPHAKARAAPKPPKTGPRRRLARGSPARTAHPCTLPSSTSSLLSSSGMRGATSMNLELGAPGLRLSVEVTRKWVGAGFAAPDRAPWHASKTARLLREEQAVPVYLPAGSPYLNAVEACWQRAKRRLVVAEHYPKFDQLKDAVSEYFRTTRFGLDIWHYLYRNPPAVENI